jgi:hypothetical protein
MLEGRLDDLTAILRAARERSNCVVPVDSEDVTHCAVPRLRQAQNGRVIAEPAWIDD